MTTLPLDVEGLLHELEDPFAERFDGLPPATVMGHVHLKVAKIPETIAFYRDVIGFALMAQLGPYAAFLSAGGYHHHLGANTWESYGASRPRRGARRCATPRSSSRTRTSVGACSTGWRAPVSPRSSPTWVRCSAIRPATRWC